MEKYCSTGQSSQRAVAPKEEEEIKHALTRNKNVKAKVLNAMQLYGVFNIKLDH
jgi:hypothetical protein